MHFECTVILDEAAASRLREVEYYRWVFENQPEWERCRPAKPPAGDNGSRSHHAPELQPAKLQ
jgi:hypothetical protein